MLAAWMVYATLLTLLLWLAALAAERVAGVWGADKRFVWLAAMLLAVGAPVVLATRTTSPERRPSSSASITPPTADLAPLVHRTNPTTASGRREQFARWREMASRRGQAIADPYLLGGWLALSATLLGLYLIAVFRLRRRSAHWPTLEIDGVSVLVAPDDGPAVVGVLQPRVVVPAWALSLDERARALMLRHESEHIRAHDSQVLGVAALSLLLAPWNPALWMIVRRLRLAVEMDCDRRVLAASDDPQEYGMLLLAVGARRSIVVPFAAALVERRPFLERRIRAMTEPRSRAPMTTSLVLAAVIVLATTAASKAPRPQPLRRVTAPAAVANLTARADVPVVAPQQTVFRPDGVITISPPASRPRNPPAAARPSVVDLPPAPVVDDSLVAAGLESHAGTREVSGTVREEGTGLPIRDAEIGVVGLLAVGEPNRTCANERGEFRLRVPDGETSLEAHAPGFTFQRAVVAPTTTTVAFSGTKRRVSNINPNDVRIQDVASVEVLKGAAAATRYGPGAENGIIVFTLRDGATILRPVTNPDTLARPLIIVNGVVQADNRYVEFVNRDFACVPPTVK